MTTRDEQLHILRNYEKAAGAETTRGAREAVDFIREQYPDRSGYWKDRELLLAMARTGGLDVIDFEQMPEYIRGSRDVALAIAMYNHGYYGLGDIIKPYTDDKDFMTQAVSAYGLNLRRASDRLRDDPDVVRAAVRSNPEAERYIMVYASERIQREGLQRRSLADIVHDAEQTARKEVGHSKGSMSIGER